MSGWLRRLLRVASRASLLRFAAVGAIGFVVDAGVLLALVALGWASPIEGRFISFACAVLVTFELNRRWSFGRVSRRPYLSTLASYVGVQSGGFLCNLGIYSAAYLVLSPAFDHPLFCLALASGFALMVNFVGTRLLVFRSGAASARETLGESEPFHHLEDLLPRPK